MSKILSIFITLLLVSCVSPNDQREIHACKDVCQHKSQNCQKVCGDDGRHCLENVMTHTKESYARYVAQQRVQAKDIALELQSFRDPLQCKKITCDCLADARLCAKACNVHLKDRGRQ